jgi:hypothetical protein
VNRSFFLCLAACRTRFSACVTRARFCARCVLCCSAFPWSRALAPPAPPPVSRFCSQASQHYARVRLLLSVHHRLRLLAFPMRTGSACAARPGRRSPRFRRVPCMRDVALDPGRATEPRVAAPHMLPSTDENVSAPATLSMTWLTPTPLMLAVYASPWSSPSTPQHSLPGERYPLARAGLSPAGPRQLDLAHLTMIVAPPASPCSVSIRTAVHTGGRFHTPSDRHPSRWPARCGTQPRHR